MRRAIYSFTGTGNSMRAAVKIAQRLGDTSIVSMRNDPAKVPAADCDIIGFVYPIYHWTMPEPAARFVEGLEINPKAYLFVVAMPSFVLGNACERLDPEKVPKYRRSPWGAPISGALCGTP